MALGLLLGFLVAFAVSVPFPWLGVRLAQRRRWRAWMRVGAVVLAGFVSWAGTLSLYHLTTPESPPVQHAQLAVGDALAGMLLAVTHVVVIVTLLVTSRSKT